MGGGVTPYYIVAPSMVRPTHLMLAWNHGYITLDEARENIRIANVAWKQRTKNYKPTMTTWEALTTPGEGAP